MIFHGVYTTPQIIDSTVSISSNNAVSSKAVFNFAVGLIDNTEAKIVAEIRDEESIDSMTSPKAVVDYVNAKLENVGGGETLTPIYINDFMSPTSAPIEVNESKAVIYGKIVQIFIQFKATMSYSITQDRRIGYFNDTKSVPKPAIPASGIFGTSNISFFVRLGTDGDVMIYAQPSVSLVENSYYQGSITYITA
jgi:hypothetical protein